MQEFDLVIRGGHVRIAQASARTWFMADGFASANRAAAAG
jgi:hypothetical protein